MAPSRVDGIPKSHLQERQMPRRTRFVTKQVRTELKKRRGTPDHSDGGPDLAKPSHISVGLLRLLRPDIEWPF